MPSAATTMDVGLRTCGACAASAIDQPGTGRGNGSRSGSPASPRAISKAMMRAKTRQEAGTHGISPPWATGRLDGLVKRPLVDQNTSWFVGRRILSPVPVCLNVKTNRRNFPSRHAYRGRKRFLLDKELPTCPRRPLSFPTSRRDSGVTASLERSLQESVAIRRRTHFAEAPAARGDAPLVGAEGQQCHWQVSRPEQSSGRRDLRAALPPDAGCYRPNVRGRGQDASEKQALFYEEDRERFEAAVAALGRLFQNWDGVKT